MYDNFYNSFARGNRIDGHIESTARVSSLLGAAAAEPGGNLSRLPIGRDRSAAILGARTRYTRLWVGALGALALLVGALAHGQTPLGNTPQAVAHNFAPTLQWEIYHLHATGGDNAVYNFLWHLSSFQLWEVEQLYNASAKGQSGIPATFYQLFYGPGSSVYITSGAAALYRLYTVDVMYGGPAPTVPGGRRAVEKLGLDIGGFPVTATILQVYTYYAAMPGVNGGQALVLAIRAIGGEAALYFGSGYALGSGISWFIQTYDPALQEAIGNDIGWTIDGISFTIATEIELQQQIETIDTLGSPGLNEVDFEGYQPTWYWAEVP